MTDCRFWGGYLLGIVTVLALTLFDSFPSLTWQIGALAITALTGLGLLLARSLGGRIQPNRNRDALEATVPPPSAPHLPDPPLASDSTPVGAPPEDLPGAGRGNAVTAKSIAPSSFPSEPPAEEHEHSDVSRDHASSDSTSGLEPSPPAPTASTSAAPEPAKPGPDDLIAVWQNYWRLGDGHFKASGFEGQLNASGFTARVTDGAEAEAGDHVLIVDPQCADQHFYVLPSFATSPRSVQLWFHDQSGGALTGTTRQVNKVALGRWTESGTFEVVKKGAVS